MIPEILASASSAIGTAQKLNFCGAAENQWFYHVLPKDQILRKLRLQVAVEAGQTMENSENSFMYRLFNWEGTI